MKSISSLSLKQKGLAIVALLLTLELTFLGIMAMVLFQAEQATKFEASAKDVVIGLNEVIFDIMKMEHYSFRYIGTNEQENRIEFWRIFPHVSKDMKRLKERMENFPEIKDRARSVEAYLQHCLDLEEQMVRTKMAGQHGQADQLRHSRERDRKGHLMIEEIKTLQDEMQPIIEKQSALVKQSRSSVMTWLLAGFICNVLLGIYLSLAFVKGITSRVSILADNSLRLAEDKELNEQLGGNDEIANLDAMFHKMSDEVKESARKERALTDNAQDVICSISKSGRLLMANPAASKNWGYTKEELLERNMLDLICPEEQSAFEKMLAESSADLPTQEYRVVSKAGEALDTLWSMHWSDFDQCYFSVVHDISERKQAERLLRASELRARTVVDSMLVGLLTVDEAGTIVSINPRTEQLLQFTAAELCGKPLVHVFPQLQIQDSINAMSELFRRGALHAPTSEKGSVHLSQLECKRKDGGILQLELWLTELPVANQEDNYLVNILDVTARHEMQKAKAEFVAVIRNDLRVPLSAVESYLQNFSSESKAKLLEDGKRKSELAMSNIGGLLRLIDDLLEINNLESGQLALNCTNTNLEDVIQRSLEAVRGFADQNKVKLHYEKAANIKLELWADPDRLGRIIINLLSNAIKFSPAEETVSVVVEAASPELCVKIIDRGRGVPASHKELIFERFKQVKSSDATQKGGSGLGLAICKAIIEQHGGTIAVDSEEGKGSCFWFKIPRKKRDEAVV